MNVIKPYTPPEPKNIIIYHDQCADGFGAAFAAWKHFGDSAIYLPFKYGQELDVSSVCTGNNVHILDFSFPRDVMERISNVAASVVWLDHHKTAFEMWCGKYEKGDKFHHIDDKTFILLDDNQSGAMLAWRYFVSDDYIPQFIRFIDDYDRWVFKCPDTKAFNKALWLQSPFNFEQWNRLLVAEVINDMIDAGDALLKAHNNQVRDVIAAGKRLCTIVLYSGSMEAYQYKGLAVNAPKHLASDVGHELATEGGTYGLSWYMTSTGRINVSLRSNGDYDVSAIAKALGGGGHKNAAGFECAIQELYEMLFPDNRSLS